ncbi:hypothetical protein PDJAM_G00182160 [Pangasius djambal]|uniref:Uncharacterized protein n=1 Tax=Pangasius djambal TaxID=1691987 RepID=A0ACC5Y3F1_9TELE|nr:hypothetical protein [Pangasius djambal]
MLFCWGDSSRGQLAFPGTGGKDIATPTSVNFNEQLVQISCGEQHTLFLTVSGQVLSCGRNSKGQLGRSKSRDTKLPVKIEGLGAVAAIACGQDHSLALCDSGQVFSWGAGGEGQLGHSSPVAKCPKPVPVQLKLPFQIPVVQVACGDFHSLALTKGGEVFSWGQNKYGQLGLGKSVDLQPEPALIRFLVGVPVIQISAGGSHTLALALSAQVFCCGANSVGQLGLNRTDVKGRFAVCAVPALRNLGVSSISCGAAHTAVLTKAGKVYTFGEGAHGQLGHNSTNNELLPKKVEGIDGPAKQVTCGSHHTLVLMPSGILFTFGRDVQVQASGGTENTLQPVRLEGDWSSSGAGIHTVMRCPEIFLLLPTCSILHEQHNVIELVLPLAVAITDLNETAMKSLKEYLSSMDASIMTKHICMWKQALAFLLKSNVWLNYIPGVKAVLEVLKLLYRGNKRAERSRQVALTEFYIEEIGTSPQLLQQDVTLWRQIKSGKVLMVHQWIHDDVTAGGIFQEAYNWEAPTPILQLKLRRTALLEDTFRQLDNADHDNFKKTLVVQFVEESRLTEVNKKDFFLHAFDELLAPESRMFMRNDSKTMIWFPAKPTHDSKRYFLFGILCGLALYNNNIVHMPFPLALFKKLVSVKPTLEDMNEFMPQVGKSLQYLLHDYKDDDAENRDITFRVHWDGADVELDSHEREKPVTSANKKEFVEAYVDYALNKSVEQVFNEFKRGFYKVCDEDVVNFFQPEELRGVMVGTEEYDWDTFRQNTAYVGQYHVRHPTIIAFWEVFEELTEKQKKAFLLFLTGCDRVPILGMDQVRMTVLDRPNFTQDHLPESITCHSYFMLPPYENKQRLEAKLIEAINHTRGFWIENTTSGSLN